MNTIPTVGATVTISGETGFWTVVQIAKCFWCLRGDWRNRMSDAEAEIFTGGAMVVNGAEQLTEYDADAETKKEARRLARNKARRERDHGMTKVRGAMGGTYWE